jgi:hypothetical protein
MRPIITSHWHRVKFEVSMAVTRPVLWDLMPYGSCQNRRFGRTYCFHHQGGKISALLTTLGVTSNRSTLRKNINYMERINELGTLSVTSN